jgi:glyceraldehyde-3-phosphate dehydrogenase/erythrose-4-phosphate dehydrogenase
LRWNDTWRRDVPPSVAQRRRPSWFLEDLSLTKSSTVCAVYSWYDNELGYPNTLVEHVIRIAGA